MAVFLAMGVAVTAAAEIVVFGNGFGLDCGYDCSHGYCYDYGYCYVMVKNNYDPIFPVSFFLH
jgi:hypothetical protein